jgi:hypothetical protein
LNPADFPDLEPFSNYLKIAANCNLIICSEYQGFLGRGATEELFQALRLDIPIYVVRKNKNSYKLFQVSDLQVIGKDNRIEFSKIVIAELPMK